MSLMIEATYENGVLRPVAPLTGFVEGQRVTITVEDEVEIKKRVHQLFQQMEEEGLIVHFPEPAEAPADFKPIEISGKPLSETIIEERR